MLCRSARACCDIWQSYFVRVFPGREGERGGRGGNRTKVHGVVVLESERGEGGGDVACGWANGVCGML